MAQYRKIPLTIEAQQIVEGQPLPSHVYADEHGLALDTLEGVMRPTWGDYRLIGVQGEAYSCKEAIFNRTYEPVSMIAPDINVSVRAWTIDEIAALEEEWRLQGQRAMETEDEEMAIDG